MAQDVSSKMADDDDPHYLKEDGYLNADTADLKQLVYHPTLNVLVICTGSGSVRVLDVNSGAVLQCTSLAGDDDKQAEVQCQYIGGQDRLLVSDGLSLGVRSDYNGVLLLDTILQQAVPSPREHVKLELLLSEAVILKQCLSNVNTFSVDYVVNELSSKIQEAQQQCRKGIKAQKWNTVCVELPLELLRTASSSIMTELILRNQHSAEMGVASAIQERLSELLGEPVHASDRRAMASEAKRRQTFAHWPHMDYQWALPSQMAQAGFYHQPNSAGDDRAMCFTCTVCLVCWERTDEPWSEHERHSPSCPFVMGEYTQNVPLSVSYATGPAVGACARGGVAVCLGRSSTAVSHLLCTASSEGLVSVFDVAGKVRRTHSFYVTHYDAHLLDQYTLDFGGPPDSDQPPAKNTTEKNITALAILGSSNTKQQQQQQQQQSVLRVRPTIICALTIKSNNHNNASTTSKEQPSNCNVMEVDDSQDCTSNNVCLYLVLYDFQFNKHSSSELQQQQQHECEDECEEDQDEDEDEDQVAGVVDADTTATSQQYLTCVPTMKSSYEYKYLMYQNLIPGESDDIYIPSPPAITTATHKQHTGPRVLDQHVVDSGATSTALSGDYSFLSPLIGGEAVHKSGEKSISDHITDLTQSGGGASSGKQLNYSRAVQCISLPSACKNREDLYISDLLPTQDGLNLLVLLKSRCDLKSSHLLLYELCFSGKMVRIKGNTPIRSRELRFNEKPLELSLIPALPDKQTEAPHAEAYLLMVCVDGAVRVCDVATLHTRFITTNSNCDGGGFVSAVYCNSLERLCAATAQGMLHFYGFNEVCEEPTQLVDEEVDDEQEEVLNQQGCFNDTPPGVVLGVDELKRFVGLCQFEAYKLGYNPVVPPCWSEMHQPQRLRRHHQHLLHHHKEMDLITKTWRLQTDTTTWDEHIFELTLPTPTYIGHVDVHFSLHLSNTRPQVEVTLLRLNASTRIGHRKDFKFAMDETIGLDQSSAQNPVTSLEYLRAHNAEILAGPIDMGSSLDLTDQSGCVTLTSPKLFKSRNRNLLIHIKSIGSDKQQQQQPQDLSPGVCKQQQPGGEYLGCDCIHELTITVYNCTEAGDEGRVVRCGMLEKRGFVSNLLVSAGAAGACEEQRSGALDVLAWVASVRLARSRTSAGEAPLQQREFLACVEAHLEGLLTSCMLRAGRSVAHKCIKLLTICTEGAAGMMQESTSKEGLDMSILSTLIQLLDNISEIKSAGALQWLVVLIYQVSHTSGGGGSGARASTLTRLTSKCTHLLATLADELSTRNNPYHLILRTRYGLYGTPLEPELFDIEPPASALKAAGGGNAAAVAAVTYASVVSGAGEQHSASGSGADFHSNYAFNKEQLCPREVLLNLSESRCRLKNVQPSSKWFKGLLETEPLHCVCVSASEGTRVERADAGPGHSSSAPQPATVTHVANSGTKKLEMEQLFNEFNIMYGGVGEKAGTTTGTTGTTSASGAHQASSSNGNSIVDNMYHVLINSDNLKNEDYAKLFADALENNMESEMAMPAAVGVDNTANSSVRCAEEILSPNKSLPWQQLLVAPPAQVMVVERMHSGARRFVTLDLGQPVLLTDLLLPACVELLSVSIDIWLLGEELDAQRLVLATDITSKSLVLSDLQPPPLCRYVKVTAVGRYGMSSTRCRIPLGLLYGHLIVLPGQLPAQLEAQLNVLGMLFEDVSCRYSLACSKLKTLLQPFLLADTTNTAHLAAYMDIKKDRNNCTTYFDNAKMFNAYQEAITYQRQLNTVRNVMCRIESSLSGGTQPPPTSSNNNTLSECCSDKLRSIAEALLEVLLMTPDTPETAQHIDSPRCEQLFHGFCISQRSHVQFLAATALDRACRTQPFWGTFLANTLARMFSATYTANFPQDRVFILLAYLVKRCSERSIALDATLQVIAECLEPLQAPQLRLLSISVDLCQLGWLLLYLSLQLDLCKSNDTRWDWVTGEMGSRKNTASSSASTNDTGINSVYRRKLHKRFLQYKQQLDNIEYNQKAVQNSAQALNALSNQAQTLTAKLEQALKGDGGIISKLKEFKNKPPPASKSITSSVEQASTAGGVPQVGKRRRDGGGQVGADTGSEKGLGAGSGGGSGGGGGSNPQFVQSQHTLTVVRGLLTLLLGMDHSCSADLFVLSCKVIARLVKISRLSLEEYMDDEKLLKLINLCIESELPFATHALACLLQDVVEVGKSITKTIELADRQHCQQQQDQDTWASERLLRDVENLYDSFDMEGALLGDESGVGASVVVEEGGGVELPVVVKPSHASTTAIINHHHQHHHLPSVFESDDSEIEDFLDEILERGRNILNRGGGGGSGVGAPKTSYATNLLTSSTAMDQRLDAGVEAGVGVTLRRLGLYTTHTLLQNINTPLQQQHMHEQFQESGVLPPDWPDALLLPPLQPVIAGGGNKCSGMLAACFDRLFRGFESASADKIEQVLQLWLTLNCTGGAEGERFEPSTVPSLPLSVEAVSALISTAAWASELSLRSWCSVLQTLTLVCNVTASGGQDQHSSEEEYSPLTQDTLYRLFAKTEAVIQHKDFVQMFLRLLSGTGIQHCDRDLAGPAVCKAMHDMLVRLQMRCDVTNPSSTPGNTFKSYMLQMVYQLVQPTGPCASKLGPLDAQCRLLQSVVHLDYTQHTLDPDLGLAMSILECVALLVHAHVSTVERIRCVNIGERAQPTATNAFSGIFASVLQGAADGSKQEKPVSWDVLLIYLLKLLGGLVQTPLPVHHQQDGGVMESEPTAPIAEVEAQSSSSQTDESKVEQQIHEGTSGTSGGSSALVACLADTALQHHPSIIRLCKALGVCKASSLSMLANISPGGNYCEVLGEPGSVGDAVFNVLACLAKKATRKELVLEPLLLFLAQSAQLSEPLLWFILQVLDTEEALRSFVQAQGVRIVAQALVKSANAPNTICALGNLSQVMQHLLGHNKRTDLNTNANNTKKQQQASLEHDQNLINFAPKGTIRCSSSTALPADILISMNQATHRRARAPQWSYHFYPEEAHADLIIQLPSAILLREVHIQPHQGTLASCPSAVSLEVSADGASRLVPACPPLPTSGMAFIRLHLPTPEVVNCVQIRLYRPRDTSNIGLSQIRVLGTSAFGGSNAIKPQLVDMSKDESHCKYSLGWLRLLHHCLTFSASLMREVVRSAASVEELLPTCCGLLMVPTHIPALYLPNLEKILCELCLHSRANGLRAIAMLLDSRPNVSMEPPPSVLLNLGSGKLLMNSPGAQSACELLYRICGQQDEDTGARVGLVLGWLQSVAGRDTPCSSSSPAYISIIASIVWDAQQSGVTGYDLSGMVTLELFECMFRFNQASSQALKHALDSLLCALCYVKADLFPLLLQKMGVLVPNHSDPLLGYGLASASICDDRKDSQSMTDDRKRSFAMASEWHERLIIKDMAHLLLSNAHLETIALVSRSPTAIQQLLDSRLPALLSAIILDYCTAPQHPMSTLANVTAIIKFFSDISEEKLMRDWLGSANGSQFWLPLLQFLCKKACINERKSNLRSEAHTHLEEVCVKFLSKCCLCHPSNQHLLARVLCQVIAQQCNGISGFLRRLILQLLLENEKIPVSVKADETLYKNSRVLHPYLPLHPAFKQTHDRALLYLPTNTTIADILDQYVSFSTTTNTNKLDGGEAITTTTNKDLSKLEYLKSWCVMAVDSDLSLAQDVKHMLSTPILKKKRYTAGAGVTEGAAVIDGRVVKCAVLSDEPLPLGLTLAQVLRMIEDKGALHCDLTCCLHLTVCQTTGSGADSNKMRADINNQIPLSSTLQVFSSMGGLALLAQHLPTVYPETIRPPSAPTTDKSQAQDQSESEWVKVDGNGSDDIYEDIEDGGPGSSAANNKGAASHGAQNVPPHSLTAFGLFLRLPGYAEVLLRDMKKALCLLRLVLGVTDDGEGVDIFQSAVADALPTLPFEVLRKLYEATPLSTDDGMLLRRISISMGVVHLLLACLGIFTHQSAPPNKETATTTSSAKTGSQLYWAKGTGFGTGSTQQSWNVEQALLKQRSEEEHVTVLLQVLSSYIHPAPSATDGHHEEEEDSSASEPPPPATTTTQLVLPALFEELLSNSVLLPALSSYLRNDSVLDMARHIPLYRALLELLRAMAASCQLVRLLLPPQTPPQTQGTPTGGSPSISALLQSMNSCVDTYASKLRTNHNNNSSKVSNKHYKYKVGVGEELERDEGLAMLMPDIQLTATMVCEATDKMMGAGAEQGAEMGATNHPPSNTLLSAATAAVSPEEKYLAMMKKLQFDTYEMIQEVAEDGGGYKFVVSHHYESNARSAGHSSHPARVKRLAQEAVTLATSLPLSHSSSVFVRCDGDRLDIMKVLMTGPADTPYANGCFEFDVYFPPDYPLAPMMINLETTGHHSVRFNPNLYNDGKVCLSVLNTWHGRPEEKWNAQTSSFLQVLVSIQSLILVSEPYFNEPGYERSRGTPSGSQSSREYNANICQATVRWAMLEQLANPCPCFREVIRAHFYLKRREIMAQCERWIADLETDHRNLEKQRAQATAGSAASAASASRTTINKRSLFTSIEAFKKVYDTFKTMLLKLEAPSSAADTTEHMDTTPTPTHHMDMEKMVSDMCESPH